MAEGKKSFVLYCDLIHKIDHLTTEEKGRLFQHLLEYVNDMNPKLEDRVLLGSWKHIEHQLKIDLIKYQEISERNRKNARKRWNATASDGMQPDTKNADNDTVTDTVTDTDIENKKTDRFDFKNSLLDLGVEPQVASDWLKVRSKKKASNTQTAFKAIKNQIEKSDLPANESIAICVENSWSGFKAEWVAGEKQREAKAAHGHKYDHTRIYEHEYWMDRIIRNEIDPRDTKEVQLFLKEEGVDVRSSRTVEIKFEENPEAFPYVKD